MRQLITYVLLFLFNTAYNQELLVNGDFEEENVCTEYKVNCAPEGWVSTSNGFSNYMKDEAGAYSGGHYMGLDAGSGNLGFRRTFICSQLLCRLRKGNAYTISFYLRSKHQLLDSIGIYFTTYHFIYERALSYKLIPSIYVADEKPAFKKGDSSWQKITMDFVATGLENFITIGNFSKRVLNVPVAFNMEDRLYVFIDSVSLRPVNPNEKICADWLTMKEEIYSRNERHEIQDRMVKFYTSRNLKPSPPELKVTALPAIDTLELPDIFFATGKSDLEQNSYDLLDSFVNRLNGRTIDSLVIEGNTDNTGSPAFNQELSFARAEAVHHFLLSKQALPDSAIIVRGNASNKNIASNNTPAGRQRNRRVDIYLYLRE